MAIAEASANCIRSLCGTILAVAGLGISWVAVKEYWPAKVTPAAKPALLYTFFYGEPAASVSKITDNWLIAAVLAGWAIVPSLWFLLEWAYLSPHARSEPKTGTPERQAEIDEFKQTQTLSKAIWVAVLAVLAVVFGVNLAAPA